MRKTLCDKCGADCTFNERYIKSNEPFYLYTIKDKEKHKTAISELTLCFDCKSKFGKLIEDFLTQ